MYPRGQCQLGFEDLRDSFASTRFVDPANTDKILSDELTAAEKQTIAKAGKIARNTQLWRDVVQ